MIWILQLFARRWACAAKLSCLADTRWKQCVDNELPSQQQNKACSTKLYFFRIFIFRYRAKIRAGFVNTPLRNMYRNQKERPDWEKWIFWTENYSFFQPSGARWPEHCGWGGLSTGEGVEFFLNRTSLTPPQIFDAQLLENADLSPSIFHFPVDFYIKIMFWVRWFYSLSERMRLKRKKRCLFTLTNL